MDIWSLIRNTVTEELEAIVRDVFAPVAPYLRKLGLGFGLVLIGMGNIWACLIALGGALFFGLARLNTLAIAALWTALVFVAIGAAFIAVGLRFLKKPRRHHYHS